MLKRYEQYLEYITKKIDKYFEDQKPFIFCKDGCSLCCQNAQFPFSLLEVQYLIQGMFELPEETRLQIEDKILETIEKKKAFKGETFLYDCPFLINNSCSVYKHRGLVCRAFGLLTKKSENRTNTPFCCFKGLNYSNVRDMETNKFSEEKLKQLNTKAEPLAYNVGYPFLTGELVEKTYKIKFGDKKPLIDWFINEKEDETKEEVKIS